MSSFLDGIQFLAAGSGGGSGARKDKSKLRRDGGRQTRQKSDWINPALEKRMTHKERRDQHDHGANGDSDSNSDSDSDSDSEDGFRSKRQKRHKAEKKAKKERKKHAKKSKKHKKQRRARRLATGSSDSSDAGGGDGDGDSDSSGGDGAAKAAAPTAASSLQRDDWMGMGFEPRAPEAPVAVAKTTAELQEEQKAKKIQDEIDAGLREPVTGMLYGLYDPKKPDHRSKLQDDDDGEETKGETSSEKSVETPLFGDGGASWRAKMLQRAKEKARESGRPLEEIIQERYGSLDVLKDAARGSAHPTAHLRYKRLADDDGNDRRGRDGAVRSRRTLEVGRDASDKVLLAKFSSRVQTAVSRTIGDDNEDARSGRGEDASGRGRSRGAGDDDEGPIDYSKLPDFESRPGAKFSAARDGEGRRSRQDRRRSRSRSRPRGRDADRRHDRRSRDRDHDHTSSRGFKRPRGSPTRSRSPVKAVSTKPVQPERNTADMKPRERTSAELEKQAKEQEELEKRNAFLYGGRQRPDASASDKVVKVPEEPAARDAENAKPREKPATATASTDDLDLNKLAAKALRAQMMGNTELFHKLKEQLNELEARRDEAQQVESVPHYEAVNGALPPLEKEDLRYGPRKGKKNKREDRDAEGHLSLDELVRQERMSSAQMGQGNMDSIHARNILRLGTKYQGSEATARNLASGFDEEDQVDMRMLQRPEDNLTKRAAAERERQKFVSSNKKWEDRTQKCVACMQSPAFKKHLMLSLGEHSYLAMPTKPRLHALHCLIMPIDHTASFNESSEQVWSEMKKFQQSLAKMCDAMYDMGVVFLEQTSAPHRKRHTFIECIPVPKDVAADTPLYFKQELMQADEEWATHKKIIDTSDGGVKRHVPQQFAYFHIEWPATGKHAKGGGYAHVIEDEDQFPRDFGVNVVAGMLGVDPPKYGRRDGKKRGFDEEKQDVLAFLKDWEGFDWTQELDGGEYEQ